MLEKFIQYLQFEKRYSEHTIIAYRNDIHVFLEFIENEDIKAVTKREVRGWMVDLMERGLKSSTVNRKLSSLRTMFEWMVVNGEIKTTPMSLIQGPKKEKRLPVFVKKSELEEVNLDKVFSDDFEGVMDRLLIETFYQTGIRLSELINLTLEDIRKDHIKVTGKRNKVRIIPVNTSFIDELKMMQELKSQNGYQNSAHVFSLKNGKKLYPGLVYRKINHYLSLASDVSKKSPHVIRHTFATHLLNNGAGIEVIKELLGHSGLAATQVYTHNSFAEINKIYSQAHPRGRK